jgi:hypothetical protein
MRAIKVNTQSEGDAMDLKAMDCLMNGEFADKWKEETKNYSYTIEHPETKKLAYVVEDNTEIWECVKMSFTEDQIKSIETLSEDWTPANDLDLL